MLVTIEKIYRCDGCGAEAKVVNKGCEPNTFPEGWKVTVGAKSGKVQHVCAKCKNEDAPGVERARAVVLCGWEEELMDAIRASKGDA